MSAIAHRALSIARPVTMSSNFAWIPLLGGLWVVTNVALGGLGIYVNWPAACAFAAGLINGTGLALMAVSMAIERFRAGATGVIAGLALGALCQTAVPLPKAAATVSRPR